MGARTGAAMVRGCFALIACAGSAHAADEVVTNCGSEVELRADLVSIQSSGGGTLTFACATTPGTIVLASTLPSITTAVTLDGGGVVTVSGGNAVRHFIVDPAGSLTLRGVTIANGLATTDGGAMRNNGTVLIEDSRFENNRSTTQSGGAILSLGPLTIRRTTFFGNSAVNGGAIYPRFASALTVIEDSLFEANSTTMAADGWGGAILAWDGAQVNIDRTRFLDNTAKIGAAYYNTANSQLTMRRTTVRGNESDNGMGSDRSGGLYNAGTATIEESLFAENIGALNGAIYNVGTLTLRNSTVTGNTSANAGGVDNAGVATVINATIAANGFVGLHHSGSALTLRNTVVDHTRAQGSSQACSGSPPSSGFNLASDASCTTFTQPGDVIAVPSGLQPLADNGGPTLTQAPSGSSLLVDRGTATTCPAIDQRGAPRPVGVSCDIGAVELGLAIFANGFE